MKKILALLFGLLVVQTAFAQDPLNAREFQTCMQGYDETDRLDREKSKEVSALSDELSLLQKDFAQHKKRKVAADASGNATEQAAVTREREQLDGRVKRFNAKGQELDKRKEDLTARTQELWKRCSRVPDDGLLAQHCQGGKAQQTFCVMATEAKFRACASEYEPLDNKQYVLREKGEELKKLVKSHNEVGNGLAERRKRLESDGSDAALDAYNRDVDQHNERGEKVRVQRTAYIADKKRMEERIAVFEKRCGGVHPSRNFVIETCGKRANAGFCAWYQGRNDNSAATSGSDIDWMFEDD
jgi:hypothetical protein